MIKQRVGVMTIVSAFVSLAILMVNILVTVQMHDAAMKMLALGVQRPPCSRQACSKYT